MKLKNLIFICILMLTKLPVLHAKTETFESKMVQCLTNLRSQEHWLGQAAIRGAGISETDAKYDNPAYARENYPISTSGMMGDQTRNLFNSENARMKKAIDSYVENQKKADTMAKDCLKVAETEITKQVKIEHNKCVANKPEEKTGQNNISCPTGGSTLSQDTTKTFQPIIDSIKH